MSGNGNGSLMPRRSRTPAPSPSSLQTTSEGPSAETREWQQLSTVIEAALREEQDAADRLADHEDEGSDYPALTVGPEAMPAPGSKDWRTMTPPDSLVHKQAEADPQTPEQYQNALEVAAELRPPLASPGD